MIVKAKAEGEFKTSQNKEEPKASATPPHEGQAEEEEISMRAKKLKWTGLCEGRNGEWCEMPLNGQGRGAENCLLC